MGKDTIASCKISRMWYNPVCEVMKMAYDNALVAGKLRRWEKYLDDFRLPRWEEIPNLGLYMEQVTVLLREYLDYLPPELKDEQFITAATINNYVRIKVMPEPVKRRYYRVHIAYLIIILTLKQSLSIALIQKRSFQWDFRKKRWSISTRPTPPATGRRRSTSSSRSG